ncbi:uncharacterized protein LOC111604314 [Drosophila hydei]|uniref:Uncharacterized protein LOC111604314 n=1 Tax=Drosophila hydei TaxID=7224 RepID=A0A6J1MBY1_DROHY|nr:uncharacterized protein LOC111604314 [Drosophila hydei]
MANVFQMLLILAEMQYVSQSNYFLYDNLTQTRNVSLSYSTRYEYCVKIVLICYSVYDNPADYTDLDDEQHANYDPYLRNNGCIRTDLTGQENATFWANVSKWQRDVEDTLLDLNIFTIASEYDNGNCLKIDLTLYFKIPRVIICDRKQMYDSYIETTTISTTTTTTTTEEPTTDPIEHGPRCNESDEKGIWITEQVNLGNKLTGLVSRLPNFITKLNILLNRNCCPYPIIRDRIEIINDIVDFLIELNCVPFSERAKHTGYALLDIQNFMTRLSALNHQALQVNQSTCSCCSNWQINVKGVIRRFKNALSFIAPSYISIISILNSLIANEYNLMQNANKAEDRLSTLATTIEHDAQKDKCCKITNNNVILIDEIEFTDFNNISSQELNESFTNLEGALENVDNALHDGESKINEFIAFCESMRLENEGRKLKFNISKSKLDQLQLKIRNLTLYLKNSFDKLEKVDSLKLYESIYQGQKIVKSSKAKLYSLLNEMEQNKINLNEAHENRTQFNLKTKNFLADSLTKINNFDNLSPQSRALSQSSLTYKHSTIKLRILKTQLSEKFKMLKDIMNGNIRAQARIIENGNNEFTVIINSMQNELTEIYQQIKNVSDSEDAESSEINNLSIQMEEMLAKEWNSMEKGDVLHAKIKKFIEQKLHDLEKKLNASSDGAFVELSNRLDYLETNFSQIRNKTQFLENVMLKKIIYIQNIFKELYDKLNNAEIAANDCLSSCDWGELPTFDELEGRIETLETLLHNKN